MDTTEMAVRTLCAGLDVWNMLTGKIQEIPFMCKVFGHKWGARSMLDCREDRFWCERCGHVEYADTTAQYRESTIEAYRQAGMSEPVMMSDLAAACRYSGLEN